MQLTSPLRRKQTIRYERSPLVEVIAEIRWDLPKEPGIGARYRDVADFQLFWQVFQDQLPDFGEIELLLDSIPAKLPQHQPIYRLRKERGTWPLIQIGPGLLTVNITPDYTWEGTVEPNIGAALKALGHAAAETGFGLALNRLELRYIDAFRDSVHNLKPMDVLERCGFISPFARELTAQFGRAETGHLSRAPMPAPAQVGAVNTAIEDMPFSRAIVEFNAGRFRDEDALIMNIVCRRTEALKDFGPGAFGHGAAADWYSQAHDVLITIFTWFIETSEIKPFLGKETIGDSGNAHADG